MLLDGDHFISKLTLMFDKSRTNGHVQITMKRYDGRSKPIPKSNSKKSCKGKEAQEKGSKSSKDQKSKSDSTSNESGEYMCLIRAVCRKEKISCVVHASMQVRKEDEHHDISSSPTGRSGPESSGGGGTVPMLLRIGTFS